MGNVPSPEDNFAISTSEIVGVDSGNQSTAPVTHSLIQHPDPHVHYPDKFKFFFVDGERYPYRPIPPHINTNTNPPDGVFRRHLNDLLCGTDWGFED
jgi:hypothetical protein